MSEIAAVGIALAAGNAVIIHGWGKKGAAGKRKLWTCREINLADEIQAKEEAI